MTVFVPPLTKDAVILKMLNDKYSPKDYIKETLYRLAVKAEKDKDMKKMRH